MKKVIFLFLFLVSILTSKNSFAQTDSIFALDAKIENGVLKGKLFSTFSSQSNPQIVIRVYKNDLTFNDYFAYFRSSDTSFYSKTGTFDAIINSNNIMEINFNQILTTAEQKLPIKIGFLIIPMNGNLTTSNELFYLLNEVTSVNDFEYIYDISNKKIYTLDGQITNTLINNTLYIIIEENKLGSSKKLFLNIN